MAEKKKIYSYIKYPHSENGKICIVLAGVSLVMTLVVVCSTFINNGGATGFLAALAVTATLLSVMGIWFAYLNISEREINHMLGWIGGGTSLAVFVIWIIIFLR